MARTLLPVFAKTLLELTEEPKEDFSFLTGDARYNYETFRAALDSIPGSREYLMNYVQPAGGHTFYDDMGNQIMSKAGSHHSGHSVVALAWQYKILLNDWNKWVKDIKMNKANVTYKENQLERWQTLPFAHVAMEKESISLYSQPEEEMAKADAKILTVVADLKAKLSLPYEPQVIIEMMNDLVAEFEKEAADALEARAKEEFESRLMVLEHHEDHPKRWNDHGKGSLTSYMFGSIYDITPRMYEEMESRRPGFTDRILAIIEASK